MEKTFKQFKSTFIVSLCLLIVIMFLPMYTTWGGTFNFEYGSSDETFFDVMEFILGGNKWMSYDMAVVQFTLATFIPTVALFIFSLCKVKGLCVTSSLCGILGIGLLLIGYCADSGYSLRGGLFGENSCISMGTWIVLGLFILAFIFSISIAQNVSSEGNEQENNIIKNSGCASSKACQHMDLGSAAKAGKPENMCFCRKLNNYVVRRDNCEHFYSYGCNTGICSYATHNREDKSVYCSYIGERIQPKDTCEYYKDFFDTKEGHTIINSINNM